MFGVIVFLVALLTVVDCESSVSFDLPAMGKGAKINRRCFIVYIPNDTMVSGTYTTSHSTGSSINFEITDPKRNVYNSRENARDTEKFSFTSHAYSDYFFCFSNILNQGVYPNPTYTVAISFSLSIGAETQNASELSSNAEEHLKPLEVELKVMESKLKGVVSEMEYLKKRETKLRDTNESTNHRVQLMSFFSITTLIACGVWQVVYLRQFFQSKKIL